MKYLTGAEEQQAIRWMNEAGKMAQKALCLRSKCGTVIVSGDHIIGSGYNTPPLDDINNRTCLNEYNQTIKPKYDKTCCMHAEWRAILDALKNNSEKIKGSKLYFTRVDEDGNLKKSGEPYCTVCSRFSLDVGITHFYLWQEQGIAEYPTDEYNKLSYDYHAK